MIKSFMAWFRHLRFLQLTVFFLLVYLTIPFRTGHPLVNAVTQLLIFNAMVVTLSACGPKPKLQGLMVLLWAAGVVLYLRLVLFGGPGDHHWDLAAMVLAFLVLMAVCTGAILPYIFRTRQVTLDTIFAAVVAYLFICSIFANSYSLIYFLNPHSFNLTPVPHMDQFYAVYTDLIYFSIITISGVGYGDIVPLLPFPRMLAALEAVLGHFYIALLIAWLVGTYISQSIQARQQAAPPSQAAPMAD
jgi:voltage-gated potassium channel